MNKPPLTGSGPRRARLTKTCWRPAATLLSAPAFDWRKIADYANRRLLNEQEARQWLTRMMDILDSALKKT